MDVCAIQEQENDLENKTTQHKGNKQRTEAASTAPTRPVSMLVVNKVQNQTGPRKLLRVLFDSGSDKTMFNQRALPVEATPELLPHTQAANTLAGNLESKRKMWLGVSRAWKDKESQATGCSGVQSTQLSL